MAATTEADNLDPQELAKFEKMASRWWDPQGDMRVLHVINPVRYNWICERSGGSMAGKRVLDIGCGGGLLTEVMAGGGAEVTGIDMGEAPLNVARLHSQETGVAVEYRQITAERLAAQQADAFDVITCLEMLEHVPNPASVVAAAATLIKPGGHLFFSTINRNLQSWLMAIVGAEHLLRLLPKGTHEYAKLIKPSELASYCRSADLLVRHIQGMAYDPFRHHCTLTGWVGVNYFMHCIKI